MRIKILFLLLFFFQQLLSQSPYQLNWKQETYFMGLGASLYSASALDRASINSFDRNATFNFSSNAKKGSDYVKYSSYTLPFLFLLNQNTQKGFGKIMALYGETLLMIGGLTSLSKRVFLRPRPFVFNELAPFSQKQKKTARYAFFSGHTSVSAANSIFAAKVFSDYFPDSKWKPIIWSTAILIPATTGFLRVKAGKHYPTDVIAGVAIGGVIGFLIPHLHRKKNWKNLTVNPSFSSCHISLTF